MLKKKTLTETVYNNGNPFQIREAISACIGAWQKREDVEILWSTLRFDTESRAEDRVTYAEYRALKDSENYQVFAISVEAVYREGN